MADATSEYELVLASGLFDREFYLRVRPDLAHASGDPLEHFLAHGWKENTDPSAFFSTTLYLDNYPDVRDAQINPVVHYLRKGRQEGYVASPKHFRVEKCKFARPDAPTETEWKQLIASLEGPKSHEVDVFVVLDAGPAETACSLFSLLSNAQETPFRLTLLISGEASVQLPGALSEHLGNGLVRVLKTDEPRIPTPSDGHQDVVLISSSVQVHNRWLDRLRISAYGRPRVATVTPFSNDAGICSYPRVMGSDWSTFEGDDGELDALAASVNRGKVVEVPVGSPTCVYIRKDFLDFLTRNNADASFFSVAEFELWSAQACAAGWLNLLATDVFARRFAPASIDMRGDVQVVVDIELLADRHRQYVASTRDFVDSDPALPFRRALDIARILNIAKFGSVLSVVHSWGGGTEHHVADLTRILRHSGICNLTCRIDPQHPESIFVTSGECEPLLNMPRFRVPTELDAFTTFLHHLRVRHVHVHHLAGFPLAMSDFLQDVCRHAKLQYDVTVHDYMFICPRIFLADRSKVYCGEPPVSTCEQCVQRDGSVFGKPGVAEWRERYGRLLKNARRTIVPNEDVSERLSSYFENLRFLVRPHPEKAAPHSVDTQTQQLAQATKHSATASVRRRVVLMGALGLHKGAGLLEQVARASLRMELPLEFVVIGHTDRDEILESIGNVTVTGPYRREEAGRLLREAGGDFMFFASVIPETFSYTLSLAFRERQFPVAFDIGAIAQRIKASGYGKLLPLGLMTRPDVLATYLADLELSTSTGRAIPASEPTHWQPTDFLRSYYEIDEWQKSK
ncbi:hypothetical protein AWB81_07234 [Caballeronia arationis]|uniref:hypothetical protein n=1 Tax=Caballeronia arationis TaxID=1777142 RepID=UPI00074C9CCF|nr:hypothetical protein [Caballeronia arationis]SAL05615.1 hypothetical protein AWB81_07234 [Caballeronia arationis]